MLPGGGAQGAPLSDRAHLVWAGQRARPARAGNGCVTREVSSKQLGRHKEVTDNELSRPSIRPGL